MKAVIPAAGFGTRFLPVSKAIPKEMLPLGEKPVIQHVVEEAAAAGFDEVLIVLSRGKECIRAYFSPDPDLESRLAEAGKPAALEAVRRTSSIARISYVYQEKMLGLGDAVGHARDFVGTDPLFAVLLGDTVMQKASPLPAMVDAWNRLGKPSVCLEPCPGDRVSRYGVAGGLEASPGVFDLDEVVEKPAAASAPRLKDRTGRQLPFHAFAARYLFTPELFDLLESTRAGFGGEIQLTDAMRGLLGLRGLLGVTWPGRRLDIGSPAGLIEASLAMRGDS